RTAPAHRRARAARGDRAGATPARAAGRHRSAGAAAAHPPRGRRASRRIAARGLRGAGAQGGAGRSSSRAAGGSRERARGPAGACPGPQRRRRRAGRWRAPPHALLAAAAGPMTFGRQKRLLIGWLALLAPVPLPFSDVVGWPVLAAYAAGVSLFLRRARRD